ncbi:5602_t:CDS:2 [Acaulospora morrowiae]|uniref:5602_t:CDS:1 n=1 Tax=Acaulospora morrowiae TaxID=94023 RepID=A0A9N9BLI0_9GLOM|nr:5602_t:CDS:2 [Acaulospora morrowiae]
MTRILRQDSSESSEKTDATFSSSVSNDSSVTMVFDSNDTLRFSNKWIKDSSDRTILFRGINLSGASKSPASPPIPSHQLEGFFDHRNVNFIGRPFHLNEADQHFARLKHWGFNFLRFIVTWEALEHSGPGIYDMEFIDFIIKILIKAREYGFRCFIDPHQDVWSRFSGGSGAPGWTLDLVGFNMRNFAATDAAIVHNTYKDLENFPKMVWSTNYYKLVSATMFTLFYSGSLYAKKCIVDGVNIQEYLQSHFCNAYKVLAEKICEAQLHDSTVIGFDTINEPSWGLVGTKDLSKIPEFQEYRRGRIPTPFQAMLLGEGVPCTLEVWDIVWYGFGVVGKERIDPKGKTAWLKEDPEGYSWEKGSEFPKGCIWASHGVWDKETKELLRPDYFATNPNTGKEPDWNQECLKPFIERYTRTIRSVFPNAIIFVQPPVLEKPPSFDKFDELNERIIYSPHWYDGMTLVQKKFNWWTIDFLGIKRGKYKGVIPAFKIGDRAIKRSFVEQLKLIKDEGEELLGDVPCIIGEIGIPYDMQNKKAYRDGDYSQQIKAMEASIQALEANLLSFTLWNYCPDNNHKWGDQWNGEDLSIYSQDTNNEKVHSMMSSGSTQGLDVGGRALESLLRPFPVKTNGEPLSLKFNPYKKYFEYVFKNPENPSADSPTEIYLPIYHFSEADDFNIYHSSGKWKWDKESQLLLYWHDVGDPEDNDEENHLIHKIIVESNRRNYDESVWDDCC